VNREKLKGLFITDNDNQTLLGMPVILDLDLLPKIVNQVSEKQVNKQQLFDKYPEVFNGLGKFGGEVSLLLKSGAEPRSLAPRLIPHKKRGELQIELNRLVDSGVIAKYVSPALWLSPIVLVNKPNGDLKICLDPQYLYSQLIRAHCAIPTLPEILSRISRSKYFTTLDAKQGFHQIPLSEESSKLTSFMTPFGKYRWLRMPMGICNAPEIFHQQMPRRGGGLYR